MLTEGKNRKFIILVGVLGLIALAGYFAYAGVVGATYTLANIDPDSNSTGVAIDTFINFSFKGNAPALKNVSVTSKPSETWKVELPTKSMLMLSPTNPLQKNTAYVLTISLAKGTIVPLKGSPAKSLNMTFTTGEGHYEDNTATPDTNVKPLTQAERDEIVSVSKYVAINWDTFNNIPSSKIDTWSKWITQDYLNEKKKINESIEAINGHEDNSIYPPYKLLKLTADFGDALYPKVTVVAEKITFIFSFAKETTWKVNDVEFKNVKP